MTDVASALPHAGWYDDPADASRLRWWDGSTWTAADMAKPSAESPASADAADAARPTIGADGDLVGDRAVTPAEPGTAAGSGAASADIGISTAGPIAATAASPSAAPLSAPAGVSARRAARAARGDDHLAPVVQLHPVVAEPGPRAAHAASSAPSGSAPSAAVPSSAVSSSAASSAAASSSAASSSAVSSPAVSSSAASSAAASSAARLAPGAPASASSAEAASAEAAETASSETASSGAALLTSAAQTVAGTSSTAPAAQPSGSGASASPTLAAPTPATAGSLFDALISGSIAPGGGGAGSVAPDRATVDPLEALATSAALDPESLAPARSTRVDPAMPAPAVPAPAPAAATPVVVTPVAVSPVVAAPVVAPPVVAAAVVAAPVVAAPAVPAPVTPAPVAPAGLPEGTTATLPPPPSSGRLVTDVPPPTGAPISSSPPPPGQPAPAGQPLPPVAPTHRHAAGPDAQSDDSTPPPSPPSSAASTGAVQVDGLELDGQEAPVGAPVAERSAPDDAVGALPAAHPAETSVVPPETPPLAVAEPVVTERVADLPVSARPTTPPPVTAEPVVVEPTTPALSVAEPVVVEPVTPAFVERVAVERVAPGPIDIATPVDDAPAPALRPTGSAPTGSAPKDSAAAPVPASTPAAPAAAPQVPLPGTVGVPGPSLAEAFPAPLAVPTADPIQPQHVEVAHADALRAHAAVAVADTAPAPAPAPMPALDPRLLQPPAGYAVEHAPATAPAASTSLPGFAPAAMTTVGGELASASGAPVASASVRPARPAAERAPRAWWDGVAVGSPTTASAWLLALWPFVSTASPVAALWAYAYLPDLRLQFAAALLVLSLMPIALAVADRHALAKRGWQRIAHPLWVLLSPLAYLIARRVRLRRLGSTSRVISTATLLGLLLAIGASVVGAWYFQEQLLATLLLASLRT